MNAEPVSLATVTPITATTIVSVAPARPLSRECAARIAGYTAMAWRYDRLPANADARLLRHYKQTVIDGWLQSGDLAATVDLWMDLKIYVAGDVALKTLCSGSPQPRFAGAGLLAYLDIDDGDLDAGETFNILWHAADAEEMLSRPVLRTALLQLFEALQEQSSLSAAEVKSLLSWDELCERYERDGARETLQQAATAMCEDWPSKQHNAPLEQRTAAE